jgi:hypothetical protein
MVSAHPYSKKSKNSMKNHGFGAIDPNLSPCHPAPELETKRTLFQGPEMSKKSKNSMKNYGFCTM